MYFTFAIAATLAYALHNVWMAYYYRRTDQLVAVTARGMALSVALFPGLWVGGLAGVSAIPGQALPILMASVTALIGNWAGANSVRHLPIGVAAALNMSLSTIVSAWLSAWLYGEFLSPTHWMWMGLIFGGVVALGVTRSPRTAAEHGAAGRGLAYCVVFGLALGTAFTFISGVSRALHPLVAGFCWEGTITVLGALVVCARRVGQVPLERGLTTRDLGWIMLYGIPGAVGTACYAMAVALGPVAVVGSVLSTMMVATSVLAWLIYRERLSGFQWLLVAGVCGALIGLRCVGG